MRTVARWPALWHRHSWRCRHRQECLCHFLRGMSVREPGRSVSLGGLRLPREVRRHRMRT